MSSPTTNSAKLAAAGDLLRLLADRKKDDAPGIMDKAILNSYIGLIEEVIGPAPSNMSRFGQASTFSISPTASTPSPFASITAQGDSGGQKGVGLVAADQKETSSEDRDYEKNRKQSSNGTPQNPSSFSFSADAGSTPFVFGPSKQGKKR